MAYEEGKTTLPPSISSTCEACEGNDSIMYCQVCPMALCVICSKSHQKIKSTSSHQLVTISQSRRSVPRSGDAPTLTIPCVKHANEFAKLVCRNCERVICNSCRSQHHGHVIINPLDDLHLLQKIAVSMISKLLEEVRKLDSNKVSAQKRIVFYKEAKQKIEQWRKVIVDIANKNADELQTKLDNKIKQTETIVNDKCGEIGKITEKSEKQLSKLNSIRRSNDADILLVGIAESDHILNGAGRFHESNNFEHVIPKMEDIFPYMSRLDQLTADIKMFFSAKLPIDDLKTFKVQPDAEHGVVDYEKQKEILDLKLDTEWIQYICGQGSYDISDLTLYAPGSPDIIKYTKSAVSDSHSLEKVQIGGKIGQMIKTEDWFVIVDSDDSSVHAGKIIAGQYFKCKDLLIASSQDKFKPWRICLTGPEEILICASTTLPPWQLKFTKITIPTDIGKMQSKDMTTICVHERPDFIAAHKNKPWLTMIIDMHLYRIDLMTSSIKRLTTLPDWNRLAALYSLFVDDTDNILIGDQGGRIHLFTQNMKHSIIHNIGINERVDGLALFDKKLVVTYGKPAHLKVFK